MKNFQSACIFMPNNQCTNNFYLDRTQCLDVDQVYSDFASKLIVEARHPEKNQINIMNDNHHNKKCTAALENH